MDVGLKTRSAAMLNYANMYVYNVPSVVGFVLSCDITELLSWKRGFLTFDTKDETTQRGYAPL